MNKVGEITSVVPSSAFSYSRGKKTRMSLRICGPGTVTAVSDTQRMFQGRMEEAGLLWGTHPVLGHTGLKFSNLGVWSPDLGAVPLLLHAALALQLLELQILIGTLGCIQLLSDLLHPLQEPLSLVLWL